MRIISKRRDYYDSAQGMGIDENLVYTRLPRKIKYDKNASDLKADTFVLAPRFHQDTSFISIGERRCYSRIFIINFSWNTT